MNDLSEKDTIKNIIEKKLISIPSEGKKSFPQILSQPNLKWLVITTNDYLLLDFLDHDELKRIMNLRDRGYNPFPGLIEHKDFKPAAFGLTNSRNIIIDSCTVENTVSIALGEDCTIILTNHKQIINTIELGRYEYIIKLSYIISFGNIINKGNFTDYLSDLIAYSVNKWQSK